MIDTLSISKELQEAGISVKEADAIAASIGKIMASELANKQDLKNMEFAFRKDLGQTRADLEGKIEQTRAGLQIEIRELDVKIEQTKSALMKDNQNIIKWVAGFLVTQTALLFTLLKLLG
ncbi:MAG TPA: hypothetical protein ACFCUD_08205 [Cyclobacteriaceae bacterium]